MANNTTLSWIPRSRRDLNWTEPDCLSAIPVYGALIKPGTTDYPVLHTIDFLKRGFARYWEAHNFTRPGDFELLEWFVKTVNDSRHDNLTIINEMNGFVLNHCIDGLCKSLPYEGNSDQAGRGMLVTYYIEAILVTTYLTVIVINKVKRRRRRHSASGYRHPDGRGEQTPELPETWGWGGISNAISASLRPFLDAAILFALAMQVAAISVLSQPYLHPNDAITTVSGAVISAFTALLSIFSAAALQFCSAHQLRRARFRKFAWFSILLLSLVIFIMYNFSNLSIWKVIRTDGRSLYRAVVNDSAMQLTYEGLCLNGPPVERFAAAYSALFGVLCLGWIVYILFASIQLKSATESPILSSAMALGPPFFMLISFGCMWTSLGLLTNFRAEISPHSIAANKDYAWTFGQILSVATFVPVAVEFGMLYFKGSKNGLTGLLPMSWKAERIDQKEGNVVQTMAEPQNIRANGV